MSSSGRRNILMVAAELSPLAKVGGLADVVPSLAGSLQDKGFPCRVIMPKYGFIKEEEFGLERFKQGVKVDTGGEEQEVNIWWTRLSSGVGVYLIENQEYFGGEKIYWGSEPERFLFFSQAVLEILPLVEFRVDVIHCHDFHTALLPAFLSLRREQNEFYRIPSVYTIHNLNYQGKTDIEDIVEGEVTEDLLKSLSRDPEKGEINFMAQGIIHADMVTTVSSTYSREITEASQGAGLEKVTAENKEKIIGIINGIDTEEFDPQRDKDIFHTYSRENLEPKKENKIQLQRKAGLPEDENVLLVGFISRLVWQKGIDIIGEELMKLNAQFLFLGTGTKKYEQKLKSLSQKYPRKVSSQILFDGKLAKQIYAGSDIYLLPSRFEPCGLGQMIAMRYGTVPVVRNTGGLSDTVDREVGFLFQNIDEEALASILGEAASIYYDHPKKWKKLQKNGMDRDFSWSRSADEYIQLYNKFV